MKKKALFFFTFTLLSLSAAIAQEQKEIKREMRKEVQVEEENGIKKLTIRTTTEGAETVEVYQGEEAEKKLQELELSQSGKEEVKEEVRVEEMNGEKIVKITRTENGQTSTEELRGEAAESKLKEIGKQMAPKKGTATGIRKKEIKRIEVKRD